MHTEIPAKLFKGYFNTHYTLYFVRCIAATSLLVSGQGHYLCFNKELRI